MASGGGGVVAALPAFGFSRDRSRLLEAYQQGRLFGARVSGGADERTGAARGWPAEIFCRDTQAVSGDGQIRQLLPCLCVTRQQPPPVSPAGGERRGYDIEVEMIWTHPRARRRGKYTSNHRYNLTSRDVSDRSLVLAGLATQMLAALGGNPLPEGGADTSGSGATCDMRLDARCLLVSSDSVPTC